MVEKIVKIPRITPRHVVVNALFLQPTYACALDCEGCYVKGMEKNQDPNLDLLQNFWNDLIYVFTKWHSLKQGDTSEGYESIYANQITLAVDVLPVTKNDVWNIMFNTFCYYVDSARFEMPAAQMDITIRNIATLDKYLSEWKLD